MSLWLLLLIIGGLGALGGVVNALITDNGFLLPKREQAGAGNILRPGFLGNMLIGLVAAVVFWGLYGPFAEVNVVGQDPTREPAVEGATRDEDNDYGETLSGLIGTLLIGIGGARFLTAEVDKRLLRAAAATAATASPNDQAAAEIATAPPADALRTASEM